MLYLPDSCDCATLASAFIDRPLLFYITNLNNSHAGSTSAPHYQILIFRRTSGSPSKGFQYIRIVMFWLPFVSPKGSNNLCIYRAMSRRSCLVTCLAALFLPLLRISG